MAENAEPAYPTQKNQQPDADQLADASIRHSNQQKAAQIELHHMRWMYPKSESDYNLEHQNEALERQFGGVDDVNKLMWILQ